MYNDNEITFAKTRTKTFFNHFKLLSICENPHSKTAQLKTNMFSIQIVISDVVLQKACSDSEHAKLSSIIAKGRRLSDDINLVMKWPEIRIEKRYVVTLLI